MNPLFSQVSLSLLESMTFPNTLFAFDLDGILPKREQKSETEIVPASTRLLLKELSAFASVTLISGKSVERMRQQIDLAGIHYIGNHGISGWGEDPLVLAEAKQNVSLWKDQLSRKILGEDVDLEDNTYSLAARFCRSSNKAATQQFILDVTSDLKPIPRLIIGKCAINFLPLGPYHKGATLLRLMQNAALTHAVYVGKDDTDEAIFSISDPKIMTVRIGDSKGSRARFFIDRQEDVDRLIEQLVRFYESHKEA